MAGMRSRAFAGVTLLCALATGLAAHAASSPGQDGEERADGALFEPAPEAVTRSVRLALYRVVVADKNRDGIISAREAAEYYEGRFGLMDLDGDQRLSWTEFAESRLPIAARAAALGGARWHRTSRFESLDLDGDDSLDREEFALALLLAQRSKDATPRHERRRQAFGAFDRDGDGTVGEREFAAAGERHFAESDADGDGRVTIWEFMSRLRF